ncbi:Asp/Glu/hydantoin racemase [Apiospora arundinis]
MATSPPPPTTTTTATMRAWTSTKTGLQLDAHRPSPAPAASAVPGAHLLLRVRYAGLNPADLALMATFPAWLPWRRNPIVGLDFVGEVLAAGPQVAQASPSPEVAKAGTLVCGALGVRQAFFGAGTLGGGADGARRFGRGGAAAVLVGAEWRRRR